MLSTPIKMNRIKENNIKKITLFALMLTIVSLGFYLRMLGINRSLWPDEVCTLNMSNMDDKSFYSYFTVGETHPILYYWLNRKIWQITKSVFGLRLLSLISSGLLIGGIALLGLKISKYCAIIAPLLALLSPHLFLAGHEARNYALFSALAVFTSLMIQTRYKEKTLIFTGLLLLISTNTHYFAWFLAPPLYLIMSRGRPLTSLSEKSFKKKLIIVFLPSFLALMIWAYITSYINPFRIAQHTARNFAKREVLSIAAEALEGLVSAIYWKGELPLWPFYFFFFLLALNSIFLTEKINDKRRITHYFLFFQLFGMIFAALLSNIFFNSSLFRAKYLAGLMPFLLLLFAERIYRAGRVYGTLLLAFLMILELSSWDFTLNNYFNDDITEVDKITKNSDLPLIISSRTEPLTLIMKKKEIIVLDIDDTLSQYDHNLKKGFYYLFEKLDWMETEKKEKWEGFFSKKHHLKNFYSFPKGLYRELFLYLPSDEKEIESSLENKDIPLINSDSDWSKNSHTKNGDSVTHVDYSPKTSLFDRSMTKRAVLVLLFIFCFFEAIFLMVNVAHFAFPGI